jgi:uncharacterized protein (DUF111 family)
MVLGALLDIGADVADIKRELDKFVQEEYDLIPHLFSRNGIHGINLDVLINEPKEHYTHGHSDEHEHMHVHEHEHRQYREIKRMIEDSGISEKAKGYACDIFAVIAEAEAAVHRMSTEEVAFHEVGAMDSIIDIVGTAVAIDLIGVDDFYCSAPHDGSGTIHCRHGLIPVPAPAVMEMAKNANIPIIIEGDVQSEMITPTGFGIIKGLGARFEPHLGIVPEKTGYGFGKRDTGRTGAVRITLGERYEEGKEG